MPEGKRKLYSVEVDQSGKIEDTRVPTVLAYSDGVSFTLRLSGKDKRQIWQALKRTGPKRSEYMIEFFSALVFLLLQEVVADLVVRTEDVLELLT